MGISESLEPACLEFTPCPRPNLKRIRELIIEKNRIFEEQRPDALDAMIKINVQLNELMAKATEDLRRPATFLSDVQQNVLRCHQIETKVFHELSAAIAG